ncbi:MAG: tRNA pseudouridine(38-40) synthase TruA [Lachnospiraceae bacterium]
MEKRIKLTVAYDGTNYCGWQIQPNGITIEEVLNKNLSELLREEIAVVGASRTDAGVHAYGNVAVFDTKSKIPAEKICYALNQRLPEDIRVMKSEEVKKDFHPRYCDSRKTYEYKILNEKFCIPTMRNYTALYTYLLDEEKMQEMAKYFIGTHDFKSFCASKTQVSTTVRTITDFQVRREENLITLTVTGTGFLYNMVRILAGTLMRAGSGYFKPEDAVKILEARDRQAAGPTAPARGLFLKEIKYL